MQTAKPKQKIDRNLTSLAGEFFVAAELLRRGLQTSVTFGNAKAIDLLAYNPETSKRFTIQVKSLRYVNWFDISPAKVHPKHVYVFVILNEPGHPPDYYIVPGKVLDQQPATFGKFFSSTYKRPGTHPKYLSAYQEKWTLFHR